MRIAKLTRHAARHGDDVRSIYIVNYFTTEERVLSERLLERLAEAQDRARAAVAKGTALRVEIRTPAGEVIWSTLS